jgi:hypothetical protein
VMGILGRTRENWRLTLIKKKRRRRKKCDLTNKPGHNFVIIVAVGKASGLRTVLIEDRNDLFEIFRLP